MNRYFTQADSEAYSDSPETIHDEDENWSKSQTVIFVLASCSAFWIGVGVLVWWLFL